METTHTVVTKTRVTAGGFEQMSVSRLRSAPALMPSAPVGPLALADVRTVVEVREAERTQLQELNERFSSCISKVHNLEEENARIVEQLTEMRQTSAEGTEQVRQTYGEQLETLRQQLEESEVQKGELDVRITIISNKIASVQTLIENAHLEFASDRDQLEMLEHSIEDRKTELDSLRTRVANFDEEKASDLEEIERLKTEIERLSSELEQEALAHVKVENERLTLREELEFRKEAFDAELKELAAIAFRGSTAEVRDFWKAELADAILDVRFEYEKNIETAKLELESLFSIKSETETKVSTTSAFSAVARVKEENERLKNEMTDLRKRLPELEKRQTELEIEVGELTRQLESIRSEVELERMGLDQEVSEVQFELTSMLEELRTQMDTRLRLRIEIAAYRKLIEYEESRLFPEKKKELEAKREQARLPPKKRVVAESSKEGTTFETVDISIEGDAGLEEITEETEEEESERADTVKELDIDVGVTEIECVTVEDSDETAEVTETSECTEAVESTECLEAVEVTDEAVDLDAGAEIECTTFEESEETAEVTETSECTEAVESTECLEAVEVTDEAVDLDAGAEIECTTFEESEETAEVTETSECTEAVESTECLEAVEVTDEAGDLAARAMEIECATFEESEETAEVTECAEASAECEKTSWTSDLTEYNEEASLEEIIGSVGGLTTDWEEEFCLGFETKRTKFKKKYKGNVQIKNISSDGRHVIIQNKSSKKQDISGWVLNRDHDNGRRLIDFTFPEGSILEGNALLSVWSKGRRPEGESGPECRFPTWGFGSNLAICTLYSAEGEEKATHTERAV